MPLPPGVTDALGLLTELIVQRAKDYAALKLKAVISELICVDLNGALLKSRTTSSGLAHVCEVVKTIDFFNLAASGKALLDALLQDVGAALVDGSKLLGTSPVVKVAGAALVPIWVFITTPAAEREAALANLARIVVYALVAKVKDEVAAVKANTLTKDLAILGAVAVGVAVCSAKGDCALADLWQELEELMGAGQPLELAKDNLPTIVSFATRGSNLLAHLDVGEPAAKLREAIDWILDVAEFVNREGPCNCSNTRAQLDQLRKGAALADAILAKDGRQIAITAAAALAVVFLKQATDAHFDKELNRVVAVVTSFSALFAEPPSGATPEERAAFRDEKKRGISQLIDSATDRRNRREAGVFSLYGSVGGHLGWFPALECRLASPLSVGVGLGWSYLPHVDGVGAVGFHVGAGLLDLGGLLQMDSDGAVGSPHVANILAPGLEVGVLFGDPEFPVALLLNGRFPFRTPDSGGELKPYFEFGVTVGLQVPLLDFN